MCLAVPGRIVAIASELPAGAHRDAHLSDSDLWRIATVDFGGVRQSVSLACLSEARLGDLVLVHVGLAICRVEEAPEEPALALIQQIRTSSRVEPMPGSLASQLVEPRADRSEVVAISPPVTLPGPISPPVPRATAPAGADGIEAAAMNAPVARTEPLTQSAPDAKAPGGADRMEGQP